MQSWHLVYTQPNKEMLVDSQLQDRGLETFFPFVQFDRGYGRGIRVEAFFPHYLFVNVDLYSAAATGLRYMPGVRTLVHFDERPAVVPDRLVDSLRARLEPYESRVLHRTDWLFEPGQRVRVTKGPFEGLDAIFNQGLDGTGRVQVLLNVLGQWTRTQVHVNSIQPL